MDALAPSRLNQCFLCNPGTTATEAEARKIEKYRKLLDKGYIFQWGIFGSNFCVSEKRDRIWIEGFEIEFSAFARFLLL